MVTFTEKAKEQVRIFLEGKDPQNWGLRIRVQGGTNFNFYLQDLKALTTDDWILDVEGRKVVIPKAHEKELQGATIDWMEKPFNTGFKIELNPSYIPKTPQTPPLDMDDPRVKKINDVLENEINPALASHGGFAQLLGLKDNIVYMQLGGGCQGCGMVDLTLKNGIEMRIKEEVPEILRIVDQTDHDQGMNPYYQASK
jgi:Fe/S biogenesis protein NfuA